MAAPPPFAADLITSTLRGIRRAEMHHSAFCILHSAFALCHILF
jgi:hypothetical protein